MAPGLQELRQSGTSAQRQNPPAKRKSDPSLSLLRNLSTRTTPNQTRAASDHDQAAHGPDLVWRRSVTRVSRGVTQPGSRQPPEDRERQPHLGHPVLDARCQPSERDPARAELHRSAVERHRAPTVAEARAAPTPPPTSRRSRPRANRNCRLLALDRGWAPGSPPRPQASRHLLQSDRVAVST